MLQDFLAGVLCRFQIFTVLRDNVCPGGTGQRVDMTVSMPWPDLKIMLYQFIPEICIIPGLCLLQIQRFSRQLIRAVQLLRKRIPLDHPWLHDLQTVTVNNFVEPLRTVFGQHTDVVRGGLIVQIFIQIQKAAHQLVIHIGGINIQHLHGFPGALAPAVRQKNCFFPESLISRLQIEPCKGSQLLPERAGIITVPSGKSVRMIRNIRKPAEIVQQVIIVNPQIGFDQLCALIFPVTLRQFHIPVSEIFK